MIIVSSRKFRDNQNSYFEKAKTEEVILQTLRYGSFRLVPVREGDAAFSDVRKASEEKNAALAANFHKGASSPKTAAPAPVREETHAVPAVDIAELVKAAVQEAVAAAVPAAAAAAAAAQAQQLQALARDEEPEAVKPARAPRAPKKKTTAPKEKDELKTEPEKPEAPELQPLFADEAPVIPEPVPAPAPAPAPREAPAPVSKPSPVQPIQSQSRPVTVPVHEPAEKDPAASAPIPRPKPAPAAAPSTSTAPRPQPRPAPVPLSRQVQRAPLSIEDELDDHEPIPEPSEEVKRHIHPVTAASADVKPDFVDPGLYTDYEDSYIVGEERPDLEAQLAAYRKQEKGGFFKRFFKK